MPVNLEKSQSQQSDPESSLSFKQVMILLLALSAAIVVAFVAAFEVVHFMPKMPVHQACVSLDLNNPPPPREGGYQACDGDNPLVSGNPVVVDNDVHTGAISNPWG